MTEPTDPAPSNPAPIESAPVTVTKEPPTELDAIRRRLAELSATLADRFDRKSWDEYLRLRRTAQTA